MALEWAEPRAWAGLLLALPLLAAHLYRKRRRRLEVAFVPLLREAMGPVRVLGRWRRLAEASRLALRLLALAALVAALADPRPARAQDPETDLLLVIDLDVTTGAVEARDVSGVTTRLDRAIDLAHALVAAHAGGRVGVVAAGSQPRALAPLAADRRAALAVLDDVASLATEAGSSDLGAAVRVAVAARADGRPARILLLSSKALPSGLREGGPETPALEVLGTGEATDDQGVRELLVAPSRDGAGVVVRAVLTNGAAQARRRRVRLGFSGAATPFEEREVDLPAGGRAEVAVDLLPPRAGGTFLVELVGEDVLAANDVGAVEVAAPTRPSVLVVHGGAPRSFVTAVLDAMGEGVDRAASGFVDAASLARAAPRDVTIVDGVALPDGALRGGGWIFLAPWRTSGAGTPFDVGPTVRDPLVWRTEPDHPLLRGVDLSTAYVVSASTIRAPGARALAHAEGELVVAEGERGEVRWIAFGLDPEGSDLPLRAALPVLLRNAIRRLGAAPRAPLRPLYRAGEALRPLVAWPGGGPVELAFGDLGRHVPSRRERGAPGAPSPRGVPGAPWRVAEFAPGEDAPRGPAGGPWLVTATSSGGPARRTVVADLGVGAELPPARPRAFPPAPAGAGGPDPASPVPWRFLLLCGAAGALLLDAGLGLASRRKVARPSPTP